MPTQRGLNGSIISANPPTFFLSFSWSDRTADSREAPFKFQPGVTCDRATKKKKKKKKGRSEKKSLSAVMSKASIFTEQLGVSSQRSDVRTHYGSATTNCFKVKVADLTVLYFKWQTQILAVATQSAVLAWRHAHTQEKESWLATEISTRYMVRADGTYFKYLRHVMFCREKFEVNVRV